MQKELGSQRWQADESTCIYASIEASLCLILCKTCQVRHLASWNAKVELDFICSAQLIPTSPLVPTHVYFLSITTFLPLLPASEWQGTVETLEDSTKLWDQARR